MPGGWREAGERDGTNQAKDEAMSLIYEFNFGPAAAGLEAVVTEVYTAVEVDGSPVTLDSAGRGELALPEGTYQATVDGERHMAIGGVLDIADSVEAPYSSGVSGSWLSGHGAPGSGSGLDDLDGINDPWRWSEQIGGWVSPAFEVTWVEDDVIPAVDAGVEVDVKEGPGLASAALFTVTSIPSLPAESAGSGIGFVIQYEDGFTHTVVPDAELDPATMFGDFTVGDAYEFPEVSTGSDGQFYLDLDTRDVYGPRTDGEWAKISTLPAPS